MGRRFCDDLEEFFANQNKFTMNNVLTKNLSENILHHSIKMKALKFFKGEIEITYDFHKALAFRRSNDSTFCLTRAKEEGGC